MTDLGTLNADDSGTSSANAINDAGQIAGVAEVTVQSGGATVHAQHAFLRNPAGGTMTDLGTLAADRGQNSSATAINAAGQVAGSSAIDGGVHASL